MEAIAANWCSRIITECAAQGMSEELAEYYQRVIIAMLVRGDKNKVIFYLSRTVRPKEADTAGLQENPQILEGKQKPTEESKEANSAMDEADLDSGSQSDQQPATIQGALKFPKLVDRTDDAPPRDQVKFLSGRKEYKVGDTGKNQSFRRWEQLAVVCLGKASCHPLPEMDFTTEEL